MFITAVCVLFLIKCSFLFSTVTISCLVFYDYRSFRLNHGQSFFNVLPGPVKDTGVRYDIPCSCDKKDKDGNPICKTEHPTYFYNILGKTGRVVILLGPAGRKKRNVEDSDGLTDEDFDLFQRLNFGTVVQNRLRRAVPAISRFSKKNATQYCRKLIADTDIGKSCAKVGSNVQELLNSCSVDLEVKKFNFVSLLLLLLSFFLFSLTQKTNSVVSIVTIDLYIPRYSVKLCSLLKGAV